MRAKHVGRGAREDHFAPQAAGLGPHVDDVIGGQHHVLVVLHDDDRIADVAQLLQRTDKALVVALVEADAGFVEDVEHVHQLRAYLRGEADALALASGQAHGRAVEGEVIQAHVQEELEAGADFLQYLGGYLALLVGEVFVHVHQPVIQLADVHRGQLVDVLVVDAEGEGLAVEAGAVALRADIGLGELLGPLAFGGGGIAVL